VAASIASRERRTAYQSGSALIFADQAVQVSKASRDEKGARKIVHSYILDQRKKQNWQAPHVCGKLQTTATHTATCKLLTICCQKLSDLSLQSFPSRLQATSKGTLNSFVTKVGRNGLLISRGVQIRQRLRGGKRQRQDSDSPLPIAGGMQDGSLQADHGLGYGLIDGDLDNVGLITWKGRECAEIRAAIKEVAVKRVHA